MLRSKHGFVTIFLLCWKHNKNMMQFCSWNRFTPDVTQGFQLEWEQKTGHTRTHTHTHTHTHTNTHTQMETHSCTAMSPGSHIAPWSYLSREHTIKDRLLIGKHSAVSKSSGSSTQSKTKTHHSSLFQIVFIFLCLRLCFEFQTFCVCLFLFVCMYMAVVPLSLCLSYYEI